LTLTKHTQNIYWEEFVENYVMLNSMILTQKKCDKVKTFNMLNNLCENKTWLKMISLYLNLFLWSKLQIYLFEHRWDKARYIVPRNELKDD